MEKYYQDETGQWWCQQKRGNRCRVIERVCIQCKKTFISRHNQQFCSHICAYQSRRKFAYHRNYEVTHKVERENYAATHKVERKIARDNLRLEALAAYGNKCVCCGETEIVFLTIDHINGNGTSHRKTISNHLFYWLKKSGYPEGFQVLCRNCNWAKFKGGCPHNKGGKI